MCVYLRAAFILLLVQDSPALSYQCAGEIVAVGRNAPDRNTAELNAATAWDRQVQSKIGSGAPYRWTSSANARRAMNCKPDRSGTVCEARAIACVPAAYEACGTTRAGENPSGHDFCATTASSSRTASGWSNAAGVRLAACDRGYVLHIAANAGDRCTLEPRWR
jgi:hypothetical protein